MGLCGKGHLGVNFLRGSMSAEGMGCWGYVGTSRNRDCQKASRSVLKDFTETRPADCAKRDSLDSERVLATARTTLLLVELVGVSA